MAHEKSPKCSRNTIITHITIAYDFIQRYSMQKIQQQNIRQGPQMKIHFVLAFALVLGIFHCHRDEIHVEYCELTFDDQIHLAARRLNDVDAVITVMYYTFRNVSTKCNKISHSIVET